MAEQFLQLAPFAWSEVFISLLSVLLSMCIYLDFTVRALGLLWCSMSIMLTTCCRRTTRFAADKIILRYVDRELPKLYLRDCTQFWLECQQSILMCGIFHLKTGDTMHMRATSSVCASFLLLSLLLSSAEP